MNHLNPKKNLQNTAFPVQLPYIAGHSLCWKIDYVNDNDDIKNGYSYIVMIIIMVW